MWADLIEGFCKVEFLCHAGDPNWLGWIVLAGGGFFAFMFIVNGLRGIFK